MKLWELKPRRESGAWEPWYDKAFGFIVRAETETDARRIAAENHGDEGKYAWLEAEQSTCSELTAEGTAAEVILRDFAAA